MPPSFKQVQDLLTEVKKLVKIYPSDYDASRLHELIGKKRKISRLFAIELHKRGWLSEDMPSVTKKDTSAPTRRTFSE